MEIFDLAVIGAGPGGYEAAAEGAKRGLRVALIEKAQLGGTCLNRGCIPTKTFLHAAGIYYEAGRANGRGLSFSDARVDMEALQAWKEEICTTLRDGIAARLKACKVTVYIGQGCIRSRDEVLIRTQDGEVSIKAARILIAVGSRPASLAVSGADLEGVVNSDTLLSSTSLFESLAIIGGGVIGLEFASFYSLLGREVTIIESMDRILSGMDREFAQSLKMILKKRGVTIHTGACLKEITRGKEALVCHFEEKGKLFKAKAGGCLIAVGRKANTEGLFSQDCTGEIRTLRMERGFLCADSVGRTSVPGIYAVGDVAAGSIQLAHAAGAAAVNCICSICGEEARMRTDIIPSCVYTDPEIASVGLTQDEAKSRKLPVVTRKYPMSANGKSVLTAKERGFIKVTADAQSGRILGAQLMCARATDMVSLFSEAIVNEMTIDQLAGTVFPHPTFSEGILETLRLF